MVVWVSNFVVHTIALHWKSVKSLCKLNVGTYRCQPQVYGRSGQDVKNYIQQLHFCILQATWVTCHLAAYSSSNSSFYYLTVWQWLCLIILSSLADVNVVITEEPGNVTRCIGQSVTFCCHYTGTRDLPLWKINRTLYVPTDLPYGHRFTFEGLQVKVRGQLNHTEYRCAVIVYREERFIKFLSPPALLTVLDTNTSKQDYMSVVHTPCSSFCLHSY